MSICVVSGLSNLQTGQRRVIKFGGFVHLDMAICYLNEIDHVTQFLQNYGPWSYCPGHTVLNN